MIIGIKDGFKLAGIIIISFCAVFVCTLFLNFNIDIAGIKNQISSEQIMTFYHAQIATGKVVSVVSGGCLLITSIIMLFFYIKHYIDTHRKELGILKALGYSNRKIAKGFWIFGISVFIGTMAGFCSSFALMPTFYRVMNEEQILPQYSVHFHPVLFMVLVLLPTVLFSLLSILYACHKIKSPVLELLRETSQINSKKQKNISDGSKKTFLQELKQSTVKSRRALVFFIGFSAFCYSSMMQMSFSMDELASVMFTIIIIMIGIILACTTLFLAITTVVTANTKTIAMMRVLGYPLRECSQAILGGYRPVSYLGFAIGTIYQYVLLKMMVTVVFRDIANVPEYTFDLRALLITFFSFVLIYELVMWRYTARIKKVTIKEIMLD